MRKLHKTVTALLILLSVAGIAFAMLFMRNEQRLALQRQNEISEVTKQLEPINEARKEWEDKDREWQTLLSEKQTGRTCILLNFDYMGRELYDIIFDLMDQYGFRGTFSMRNGRMPSWEMEKGDDFSSGEMMQEMLDAGWDYAVSVGEETQEAGNDGGLQRDFSDEFGEIVQESESQGEEGEASETVQAEDGEAQTEATAGFLTELDNALTRIAENGYTQPVTVFCTQDQFAEITEQELLDRGFTMVSVKDTEELPMIADVQESDLWIIDAGEYTQNNENLEKNLDAIVAKQQSAAIMINEVLKISKNTDYDLSLTTFTSLLNYLKELESDRKINVLTYSEYYQYEQLRQQSYDTSLAEYAAFREEMTAAIEELDIQEAQIAAKLKETESVFETGGSETANNMEGQE